MRIKSAQTLLREAQLLNGMSRTPPEKPESDNELAEGLRALWIERADGAAPFIGGDD